MLDDVLRIGAIASFLACHTTAAQGLFELCKSNASAVKDVLIDYLPANSSIEKLDYVRAGDTYGDGALDLMYPVQPVSAIVFP